MIAQWRWTLCDNHAEAKQKAEHDKKSEQILFIENLKNEVDEIHKIIEESL